MKIHGKGRFEIHNKVDGAAAEVMIYGVIGGDWWGDGVIAADLIKEIKALKLKSSDTLRVRINSVGGSYFEGINIYNYLKSLSANVHVVIDALAASAASLIAIAGDTVDMPANTYMMIHAVSTIYYGNADQFRKEADNLEKLQEGTILNYLDRANDLSRNDLIAMLYADNGDGTWFSAQEAVDIGFADNVIDQVKAAACADPLKMGMHAPSGLILPESKSAKLRSDFEKLTA